MASPTAFKKAKILGTLWRSSPSTKHVCCGHDIHRGLHHNMGSPQGCVTTQLTQKGASSAHSKWPCVRRVSPNPISVCLTSSFLTGGVWMPRLYGSLHCVQIITLRIKHCYERRPNYHCQDLYQTQQAHANLPQQQPHCQTSQCGQVPRKRQRLPCLTEVGHLNQNLSSDGMVTWGATETLQGNWGVYPRLMTDELKSSIHSIVWQRKRC